MEPISYLVFSLHQSRYGIPAVNVQEVFFLPELTPIIEAPQEIVGVVNLRGYLLPVMDLDIRFGHRPQPYEITDSVIVLEVGEIQIGMIVNQVHEVLEVLPEWITNEQFYNRQPARQVSPFVKGMAQIANDIIVLLNPDHLTQVSEKIESLIAPEINKVFEQTDHSLNLSDTHLSEYRNFCPQATPEERGIFQQRAENLRISINRQDFKGQIPLAVIGLNGEYFGLELEMVQEFTECRKITPIPCTPTHIIGNMNLRGEILTLIDIRGLLSLSINHHDLKAKAMVIKINDLVAGIVVDEVFDVMYLNPAEIMSVPAAIHTTSDEYLRGTAPYRDKVMSLLDMPKVFTKGELVVNEEI
jgi:purine-binding chemotaxis protein CheW